MNARRELLVRLFQSLQERQVPYCVLRNFDSLFDDSSSDVDIITTPHDLPALIGCCIAAAEGAGQSLIQRTRFVNHSLVFWDGRDGFTRIDVDTELRWKRFHLLTAAEILATRRAHAGGFFTPDAAHESVILLSQALWQGKISGRYAQRLLRIRDELGNTEQLRSLFQRAFGLRENLLAMVEDPNLTTHLRDSTKRHAWLHPAKLLRLPVYIASDARRLIQRRRNLPGATVRLVGASQEQTENIATKLAVLFPVKKNLLTKGHATSASRLKTLFKGGLAIEAHAAQQKPGSLLRSGWSQPDRGFAAVQSEGRFHFIHAGSGFMRTADSLDDFPRFICESLVRLHEKKRALRRGAFAVLLGLDGAGKTTLARNLIERVSDGKSFSATRYFHWLPPVGRKLEFPLPEPGNQPRKTAQPRTPAASTLSMLRLLKNIFRAQFAWWFHLRGLCGNGRLVLVDRYFYNYHLDPASVKYCGPRWLLRMAGGLFPKPDVIITLAAPPEILLARKQELSAEQIREQAATLATLDFGNVKVIRADATKSAADVAQHVMAELLQWHDKKA